MKKYLTIILTSAVFSFAMAQEISIRSGWKFSKGDNPEWKNPNFDDSNWGAIEVDRSWESQGFEGYDGYAWYRLKVFIPSTLKQSLTNLDSLSLLLGIIDDHDQVFLNGQMIGQNAGKKFVFGNRENNKDNSAYNLERKYIISIQNPAIIWDSQNTIAIRVFDQLGEGGVLSGKKYCIKPLDELEDVELEIDEAPFEFKSNGMISKLITLKSRNIEKRIFNGKLNIEVSNQIDNSIVASYSFTSNFNYEKPWILEYTVPKGENLIAKYTFISDKTQSSFSQAQEIPYILTPNELPQPKINGAKIFGCKPNNPFLFKVAASGIPPLVYNADNLPAGLTLDSKTGFISGVVSKKGNYKVLITVSNKFGNDKRELNVVCGDKIMLTPPMGWNSWNCWGLAVSDEKVRASAKAMLEKGLINYGWTFINIDDGWEDKRDNNKVLQPNSKFPDMKKLCTDVHNMGLKIGIYSSPGPLTCGQFEGSLGHEQIDATTWANWGIDYLKYDFCTYYDYLAEKQGIKSKSSNNRIDFNTPKGLTDMMYPYQLMQKCLSNCNRDIVYSLCQYGLGDVWKWGKSVNAQLWRTTGDIEDTWRSMSGIGFKQANISQFASPGAWNDPDMLVVGKVGWGPKLHNSKLSPNEQYTHISLWAMLSAPLLIGCDMAQLDDFTLGLLKNSEVLDINQDVLGKQATKINETPFYQIWKKELEGGKIAIAIFNLSEKTQTVTLEPTKLGISPITELRDVWRQKNIGKVGNNIKFSIAPHGVYLVRTN